MDSIQRLKIRVFNRAGSPLVVHCFSEKAKKEIRDKQQKKAKRAKEERRPREESEAAKYRNADGLECFPVTALKKAIVSAARVMDGIKMTEIRQSLFVDAGNGAMLVPIKRLDGTPHEGVMREDAVTIGISTRGLAYRPEYTEWQAEVLIEFDGRMLSRDQVIALVQAAGFGVGICEGRPEKSSALGWGRFECEVIQ
ncbi:MAG: hypothetical protein KAY24_01055 [Candidatus Eisenbacteria sp.]|nr:hypothetical protein [Candidatus Eisenbacteria bacterium]